MRKSTTVVLHHCCCYCAIPLLLRLTRVLLAASTRISLLLRPWLGCCCRVTRRRRGGNSKVSEGYSASTAELSAAAGVVGRSLLLSARSLHSLQGHMARWAVAQGRAPGLTSARTGQPRSLHIWHSLSPVIITLHSRPNNANGSGEGESMGHTKFMPHTYHLWKLEDFIKRNFLNFPYMCVTIYQDCQIKCDIKWNDLNCNYF